MNKYQEALEYLTEEAYSNYFRKYVQTSKEKVFLFKSAKALQELVDRATPKKPDYWGDGIETDDGSTPFDHWDCPHCHHDLNYEEHIFCPNCGQAIDWSEE